MTSSSITRYQFFGINSFSKISFFREIGCIVKNSVVFRDKNVIESKPLIAISLNFDKILINMYKLEARRKSVFTKTTWEWVKLTE